MHGDLKLKPPYQLKIFKGYKNVMIRRDFAQFIIYHPVAKKIEEYMTDTLIPDEHIYATMSRIKQIEEKVNCGNDGKNEAESCHFCPKGHCSGDCIFMDKRCVLKDESMYPLSYFWCTLIHKDPHFCSKFFQI